MNARRFYREVSVEAVTDGGYSVLLDGKTIRTPTGAALALPAAALAEAIAEEWRGQADTIRPETMILTTLANTAIDLVRPNRQIAIEQILAFARSDLVCYRAQGPENLVRRQAAEWDPLLDWARTRYGATLVCGAGIVHVEQPPQTLEALEGAIAQYDDFELAGLHAAATLLGSAIVALALSDRHVSAEQALAAAQLDELYQAERWGQDVEMLNRSRKKTAELTDITEYFLFLRVC
ncbi:MAG TPA: ATP12 family protein [Micropepsaceae bacterium]